MRLSKISNIVNLNLDNKESIRGYIRSIDLDLKNLFLLSQDRIRFGDGTDGQKGENMSGEFQVVADTGAVDTEFSVTHTLGVTPIGYLVTKINKGGVVYDSGTAWTSTTIYLKCSAANAAVTLFLLK